MNEKTNDSPREHGIRSGRRAARRNMLENEAIAAGIKPGETWRSLKTGRMYTRPSRVPLEKS
jgi:hypothetical protein